MKSGVSNDGAHLAQGGPVLLPEEIQTKLKHHVVVNQRSIAHLSKTSATRRSIMSRRMLEGEEKILNHAG